MRLSRLAITALAILFLASCKIRIVVPEGGSVTTSSGAYSCNAGKKCNVDVLDFLFDETFIAKPASGYIFKYWKKGDRRFCGGDSKPCRLFTTGFKGDWVNPILEWLESDEVFYLQPVFEYDCGENQTPQTIAGIVDGDRLTIGVSDQFAGSVDSLKWRGKEFVNVWDHGRQIQYAWRMDGYSECLNPTEAGSALDYKAATTTSELQSTCKPAPNVLRTINRLAYWLAPGGTGYCSGGTTTAVNKVLLSDQLLEKTVTVGYEGLENVIAFDAVITNPTNYKFMDASIPVGYLTYEFTSLFTFNPQSGVLTTPKSEPLDADYLEAFTFLSTGFLPTIIATKDGAYAMGAYYGGSKRAVYQLLSTGSTTQADRTNIWNIVIEENPYPAGTYRYQTFAVVGTLKQVQTAMVALYKIHPVDFTLPEGSLDVVNCAQIAGWSYDPGEPDKPLQVAIYEVNPLGNETFITKVMADIYRVDLKNALKGNGVHGFDIPTPAKLRDGRPHTIRAYGINPDPKLPPGVLFPAGVPLKCD